MSAETPKKRRRDVFKRYPHIFIGILLFGIFFSISTKYINSRDISQATTETFKEFSVNNWNTTAMSTFTPPKLTDCNDLPSREPSLRIANRKPVEEALSFRAEIRGFHKKLGMADPQNWMYQYRKERNLKVSQWFGQPRPKKKTCHTTQPPYQYPGCLVHINHHYKFIWIKGKKVGGTSLREPLGWICGDDWKKNPDRNMTYCSKALYHDKEVTIEEAKAYWSEYFVFAFVRNPYSRFASSYTYIDGLMGGCSRSYTTFEKVCCSPFLQAKVCSLMTCCWSGAVSHHIHHIMEQSSCLFTENGDIAVDFVGETESINEDLQTILDVINRKRDPELPELTIPGAELKQSNKQKSNADDYAAQLYEESEICLGMVEDNYFLDFLRLGYSRISDSLL